MTSSLRGEYEMSGVWHFHMEIAILKYTISLHSFILYNKSRYFKKEDILK